MHTVLLLNQCFVLRRNSGMDLLAYVIIVLVDGFDFCGFPLPSLIVMIKDLLLTVIQVSICSTILTIGARLGLPWLQW